MIIRRGTTPTIDILIPEYINWSDVNVAWVYIWQGSVKIDKSLEDIDASAFPVIRITLTQEDTLSLTPVIGPDGARIQVRLLMNDGTALASQRGNIVVTDVDKDGVIGGVEPEPIEVEVETDV